MLKKLLNQRATILWKSTVADEDDEDIIQRDAYNNPQVAFTDVSQILWPCRVDPVSESEFEDERDTRQTLFRLILTEKANGYIDALCRVEVDDITYDVIGQPKVYRKRSAVSYVECLLRVIQG